MERHWKNFCPRAGETFEQEHRQEIKTIIAGTAVIGSLLAFTTAASAAWD